MSKISKLHNRVNQDSDIVAQWRALKKIGAYTAKENPSLKNLTKARKTAITKKFNQIQNLQSYYEGTAYDPFHKQSKKTKQGHESITYNLDTDHFQFVKKKVKRPISESLKTNNGLLVIKSPREKVRVTKNGSIEFVQNKNGAETVFSREPVTGAIDIIKLLDDIKQNKIKLRSGEALQLWNNGARSQYYEGDSLHLLAARLERYVRGELYHGKQGSRVKLVKGDFNDWAQNAEIVKIRVK